MTWGELLAEKSATLDPEQLVEWLLSPEADPVPYNPWLKAMAHARAEMRRKELAAE